MQTVRKQTLKQCPPTQIEFSKGKTK